MGHIRLGALPRTRRWQEVVSLIEQGARVEQIANSAIRAAESGLAGAARDEGAVQAVRLLLELPHAARADDFRAALYDLGLPVGDEPDLFELTAAFCEAVDALLPDNRGRTDLGEMAQVAAVEVLTETLSARTASLFEAGPGPVREALSGLAAAGPFGSFFRHYFGRLIAKVLGYFLSRTLYDHVGEGRRFLTLDHVARFDEALAVHCLEAATVVQRFSADWAGQARYQRGGIGAEDVRSFLGGAMAKLTDQLKRGSATDGD